MYVGFINLEEGYNRVNRDALWQVFLCSESKEDLRVMMRQFVEVCRRRELKVNAGKEQGDGNECRGRI